MTKSENAPMGTERKCLLIGCDPKLVWRLHEICPELRVERAETIAEGVAFLTEGGYEHLILDSRVPHSLEFLQKLAPMPQYAKLKRAVCLDRKDEQPHVVHAALSLKVSRIFYHPVEPREVARELSAGMRLKTPVVPLFTPNAKISPENTLKPLLDKFREVSRSRAVRVMVEFPNSVENLELRRDLEREAHKLKGSLGSFGFPKGSELARELEATLRSSSPDDQRVTEICRGILRELDNESAALMAQDPGIPIVLVVTPDHNLSVDLTTVARRLDIRTMILTSVPDTKEIVLTASLTAAVVDLSSEPEDGLKLIRFLARGHVSRILALIPEGEMALLMEATRAGAWKVLTKGTHPDQIFALTKPLSESGGRLKVLAVDDDPILLGHLRATLATMGLMVKGLCDPQEFWEVLEAWSPDMLILDVDMPVITGIELCRAVRATSRWGEIPIIIITARDDAETKFRVFRAGADDYICKPFVEPELRQRIANRLGQSRMERELSEKDPLTGLLTRGKAVSLLRRFLHAGGEKQMAVSVAIIDLDRFKHVNDTYGHPTGDEVLKTASKLIKDSLRDTDVVARWGGEEIVVGIYGMAKEGVAARLRHTLNALQAVPFQGPKGEPFRVSFSAGVAQFPDDGKELDALLDQADAALYRAKEEGRARVTLVAAPQTTRRLDLAIIEDDLSLAEVLVEACEARCLGVVHFTKVRDLLEAMNSDPPLRLELMLIDYDLPDYDGLSLLRLLKERGVQQKTLMVSGKMGEKEILEALDLGVIECLQKPLYLSVLMKRIERALQT